MDIDFGLKLRGGYSPEGGPAYRLPSGIKNYYRERRENYKLTKIDISRTDPLLLDIPLFTKFDGNCQSTKYIDGYRDKILEWIQIRDKGAVGDPHICIIHMRCGDFVGIKDVFLPAQYYIDAMNYIRTQDPLVKFECVTDDREVAQKILPGVEIVGSALINIEDKNKASHHRGGPINIDFLLLMNAQYLIIPNSSFSWWASYLNTVKKVVVAPKYWAGYNRSDGYWSTSDIITDGITYIDRIGKVFSAEECQKEKDKYESQNKDIFVEGDIDKKCMPKFGGIFKKELKKIIRTMRRRI